MNISAQTRKNILEKLGNWKEDKAIISTASAKDAINNGDILQSQQHKIFDKASKETSLMLYQNVWLKFRAYEIELSMAATTITSKKT